MKVVGSSALPRVFFAVIVTGLGFVLGQSPVVAQPVTVMVGGQPLYLQPGPIERAGRVFVPMRSIFERLGATVVYDSGAINATKGGTTVGLRIGTTRVVVDGEVQHLDVAPFIVGATTYVPLRFVAQSLGAQVGYDGATRVVAIEPVGGPVRPIQPIPIMPPNPPAIAIQVRAQQPAPGASIGNRFPTISAQFSHRADPGSVRVWLDGNDITSRSGVSESGFSYGPPAPLYVGGHTVRVAGYGAHGLHFDRSWSFTVAGQAPPPVTPIELRAIQPPRGASIANRFVTISAEFTRPVEVGSVRVWLDGNNITSRSGLSQTGFSYGPPAPLNFGSHTVRVAGRGLGGLDFDRSWSFATSGSPPPVTNPIELTARQPAPGSRVNNRFAVISAQFSRPVDVGSVRVLLDGNNITGRSGVSANSFSYTPPAPLTLGARTVRVTGRGQGGLAFDRSWSFTVAQPAPSRLHLTINQPAANAAVGRSFAVGGNTVANGRVRITAGASTEATDQFTGNTVAGPLGNFRLQVTLSNVLIGQQTVRVKITATDPVTSQSTTQTLQLRLTNH